MRRVAAAKCRWRRFAISTDLSSLDHVRDLLRGAIVRTEPAATSGGRFPPANFGIGRGIYPYLGAKSGPDWLASAVTSCGAAAVPGRAGARLAARVRARPLVDPAVHDSHDDDKAPGLQQAPLWAIRRMARSPWRTACSVGMGVSWSKPPIHTRSGGQQAALRLPTWGASATDARLSAQQTASALTVHQRASGQPGLL
jgi:hypothetical protein